MQNLYSDLEKLLKKDERLFAEGKILKNKVSELAIKLDKDLIELLFKDKEGKAHFFIEVAGKYVFDQDKFLRFINNKEFLPDSFTAFKNHIGLAESNEYLKDNGNVVLAWPYKDCVLEGGQSKEDAKRKEIFYNETLAPDEIDRLFEPKVLTNLKIVDKSGEHKIGQITERDNLIIKGNNLLALHTLKKKFRGKVRLIYIDPPFNTGNDSFNYNDSFNHSAWLVFMKNRLEVAKQLLSDDGSIFIHIDHNEAHYLKVLMDEIFGREHFINEIIWRYGKMASSTKKYLCDHDTILFYSKTENYIFNKLTTKLPETVRKLARTVKDGKLVNLKDKKGNLVYIEKTDKLIDDVWDDIPTVVYASSQFLDFSGQKPELLLQRIIETSTNEKDIVLDFFAGTGTTGMVAHKLNRQFILIEQMDSQIKILMKRIVSVFKGGQEGISKAIGWKGGGSLIYAELKQWNESYSQAIQKAKTTKELIGLYKKMQAEAFFRYEIDLSKFDKKEFGKLGVIDQKKILLECLDKNHLYVNYSEIEDATYKVPTDEKKINKAFYGN